MFKHINKGNFSTHTHTQVRFAEQGRSLVEMLGTLAIMGILSMAGIWAYNAAMDKLKANTIINEAQKRAVVVAGQIGLMGSTHPTLGEFKENAFGGGTFSTNVITEGLYKQFGIQVSGVSKRICQNILNSIGDDTPIRRITYVGNPKTAITDCEENNSLLLIYNNNMSTLGGDTIYAADNCGCQTVCGQCVMDGSVSTCRGECPVNQGNCFTDADCQGECMGCVKESGQTTGTCQTCQRVAYLVGGNIDSNFYPTDATTIRLKYTPDECVDTTIFGYYRKGETDEFRFACHKAAEKSYLDYGSGYRYNRINMSYTILSTAEIEIGNRYIKNIENNSILAQGSKVSFDKKGYSIKIPASSAVTIYYFQIYDKNILVRDFVPVLDPWGVPAMFDKVNNQLYYNAGTGNFSYPSSP